MGEIDTVVEDGGLAEDQIIHSNLICLLGVFATVEPGEVTDSCAIGEVGDHPFLARSHGVGLETEDMTDDLDVRHVARQLMDGVNFRAVYIFVRIVFEQVAKGLYAEFVT